MQAFKISDINIKFFMGKLLKENTFDNFEVRGIEVCSFTKFEINGILADDERNEDSKNNFCKWEILKPYIFQIIKGNAKPKSIKIIFSMPIDQLTEIHSNASALFLNMLFVNDEVIFTIATSQKNFTLDKSVDNSWNDYIVKFLNKNEIPISFVEL